MDHHALQGHLHAELHHAARAVRRRLAAVVKAGGDADGAGIKELIVKKVKGAIDSVGDPKKG